MKLIKEINKLKLYDNVGYDMYDVSKFMKKHNLYKKWCIWYEGSTGMLIDGRFIIYKWDIKQFLQGNPNLD